jgi:tetratricopeptide (TPR) repeat protein
MTQLALAALKPPVAPTSTLWLALTLFSSLLVGGCALATKQTDAPATAAVAATPGSDVMYDLLVAELAGQREDYATALELYLKIAHNTRNKDAAARAMQIAVFMRDNIKALNAATLWTDIDPDNIQARQGLVVFLIRNGHADEALPHLETLLAAARAAPTPASPPTPQDEFTLEPEMGTAAHGYMQIAAMLGAEQDKPAVLQLMKNFVGRHDNEAEAHFAYANLAYSAGDLSSALAATGTALQRKPGWPSALVLRARILQSQGDTAAAITALGEAVKQSPKDLSLRLAYARLLVDNERIKEARAQFAIMARQSKDNGEAMLALGLVSLQIKQLDDAERYLKQTLKLNQREAEAHYYLGQIAEEKKQRRVAIEHYTAVTEGELWLDAHLRVARLTTKERGLTAGRDYLHTLKVQNPQQQIQITLAEGDLLSEHKQYEQAMALYNRALTEQPNDSNLLYARAMLAEKMDRLDLLELDLQAILEREPENATALNGLGYTLADRTTRHQEALGYIQRALQLRPQDPAVMDSMGWVLYRMGRHQEALRYLQAALELADDAEIAAHLGEVLWVTGDQKGALEVWEQGLKVNPEHEVLLKTMQRFSR